MKARRAPTKRKKKALSIIEIDEDDDEEHSESSGIIMPDLTPASAKTKRSGSTILTPKDVNAAIKPYKSAKKI
jgi:hypothetical protein